MSRQKRPRLPYLEPYNDANVRTTLARIFEDLPKLGDLAFPPEANAAKDALELLDREGCDEDALLQLSFAFAVVQHALKKNRKAESARRPEARKVAFTGGLRRRADVLRIAT